MNGINGGFHVVGLKGSEAQIFFFAIVVCRGTRGPCTKIKHAKLHIAAREHKSPGPKHPDFGTTLIENERVAQNHIA